MEKKIVYIAYLIIFFVIFNFLFGFTARISAWQMWNWYLVILFMVMGVLLFIKYKQNHRSHELSMRIKETDQYRLQLNQLLLMGQFTELDEEKFNQFLERFFKLKGFDSIEIADNRDKLGYDLIMWSEGKKIMLKWFRNAPLITSLYSGTLSNQLESGNSVTIKEVREAYGVMKDFEVQADQLILLSTTKFDESIIEFATRNQVELLNGEQFYYELEQLREPQSRMTEMFA